MIHFSRNPLMARVLTEMKYMRELGEGIDRMILEMEQMGLVSPIFEEFAFMVRVTLRNNLEQRGLKINGSIITKDDIDNLNERQRDLLVLLKKNDSISRLEYERMFSIGTVSAKKDLQDLINKKLIEKIGSARYTRYKAKL